MQILALVCSRCVSEKEIVEAAMTSMTGHWHRCWAAVRMEVDTCGPMDGFEDLLHLVYMSGSNVHESAICMNHELESRW